MNNQSGLGILVVLVASSLFLLGSFLLMRTVGLQQKVTGQVDKSVRGDRVLVFTGSALQQESFDFLVWLCQDKAALGTTVAGNCVVNGKLNNTLLPPLGTVPGDAELELLRDWDAQANPKGQACVELNRCDYRAGGRVLEVLLRAYWEDANRKGGLGTQTLSFVRTRW